MLLVRFVRERRERRCGVFDDRARLGPALRGSFSLNVAIALGRRGWNNGQRLVKRRVPPLRDGEEGRRGVEEGEGRGKVVLYDGEGERGADCDVGGEE